MKLMPILVPIMAISTIMHVNTVNAQKAPVAGNRGATGGDVAPQSLGEIDAALNGSDNFQVQEAIESAKNLLSDGKEDPKLLEKLPKWLRLLISQRRFDEVEEVAVAAINYRSTDLSLILSCDSARIRAKLLAGKPQEALAIGKGLYNVCAMPDTSKAIDLISECLYDLNKDADPAGAVKKFKLQQIHGAASTQPSSTDGNVLRSIHIDPKPYQAGIEHTQALDDGWEALMGQGNLLLIAGQTKEAQKVFDKAYSLASDKNLAAATEAVARGMRAEDGTVGRANAWILSLRPVEQAAQ